LLRGVAETVQHHAAGVWGTRLAEIALKATAEPYVMRVVLALVLDGTLMVLEGWALALGATWGLLLVALTMGAFVPFEVVALARHFSAPRVALLVLNVAIVAYLLSRYRAERRLSRAGFI